MQEGIYEMLVLKEIQPINISMGSQPNVLAADFSKPSFKTNDKAASPSNTISPSAAKDSDKFEKKESDEPKNKLLIGMTAIAGTSTAGLAFTWARLGKILKLLGIAAPFALFGRLSKVHELSIRDGLTGLFNKKHLLATLSEGLQKATQKNQHYSVAMLDMDNFKAFNEIFDHNIGDDVLKRISVCIQNVTKKHKVKGYRYGGEEFTVLMPEHTSESAQKVLQEISEAIRNDKEIQKFLPEFRKKAEERIAFVSPKIPRLNAVFQKLRNNSGNSKQVANEITALVEEHIREFDPTDAKPLKDYVAKLKAADGKELAKLLAIRAPIGVDSTLGNELDKIYRQYGAMKHDREKWLDHLTRHNMFTISSGVVNLQDGRTKISEAEHLLGIADEALKSAKENGKNTIVAANDELIKSTIDKINKKKAA